MCGRYTMTLTLDELMMRFIIGDGTLPWYGPKYNIAPGQMVPVVINDGSRNRLGELRWGLIPSWATDEKIGYQTLNARSETLGGKPAFRVPFERKRCLIPADGFYEWKKTASGKQPMRIQLKHRGLFGIAGLYDTWLAPDGRKISTCTLITTAPNRLVADIHDRMPAIIHPDEEAAWLDRTNGDLKRLRDLLRPYPAEEMLAYPVSPLVGNVRNDNPELIVEAEAAI